MSNERKYKKKKSLEKTNKILLKKVEEEACKIWQASYYNQGKWINENEYGRGRYNNKCYDDYLDLIRTDESYGIESEAESHNDSVPLEIIYLNFF